MQLINPATKESAFIDLLVTKLQLGNQKMQDQLLPG
jgi:hypothetical protein